MAHEYTTWMSAVHAGCVIVQIYKGIEEGLQFSESLFDCGPEDGGCDALLLGTLLEAEGLGTITYSVTAREVQPLIEAALDARRISLFQVKHPTVPIGKRWAIVQGSNGRDVIYAITSAPGELDPYPRDLHEFATGELVVMQIPAYRPHNPVAQVAYARE